MKTWLVVGSCWVGLGGFRHHVKGLCHVKAINIVVGQHTDQRRGVFGQGWRGLYNEVWGIWFCGKEEGTGFQLCMWSKPIIYIYSRSRLVVD